LSSEYGFPTCTIYKWISELKPFMRAEDGAKVNKKELQAMKKRIKELELENEILKKTTAIFAKKH
jgi:transposase